MPGDRVPRATVAPPGYGPWRLGMTKSEVQAVSEFGPYKVVPSTGGLETANGVFEGRKTNVSFVFGEAELRKIQIWAYEGPSLEQAIDAAYRVHRFMTQNFGDVVSPTLSLGNPASDATFPETLRTGLNRTPADGVAKFQMAPGAMPKGYSVFCSFFRHPAHGYYVFLYVQAP